MDVKRVGFDFDKVFVDYPPLIPDFVIDYLYKKRNGSLKYRFPGKLEQKIRILSHFAFFRLPIKKNIIALKKISAAKNTKTFLISSRFSFLKKRTNEWLEKNKIDKSFKSTYFNFKDEQPHIFKDRIIKKEKITDYIDDDLDLLKYLSSKNPKVNFYWLSNVKRKNKLPSKILNINDIGEFVNRYL